VNPGFADVARLLIDEESYIPLPEQIRRGIHDQIRAGILPANTRLPTVRQLARDLDLAPGTVAKGYQLLEAEGAVETRGRRGTFVATATVATAPHADNDEPSAAREAALHYLRQVGALGLTPPQGVALVAREAAESEHS
jgi:DNA-binding transcriptional regulator YhcF (GntR family)